MFRVVRMKLLNHLMVDFELKGGEVRELKGKNGVGKSLLLKSLARLLPSSFEELSLFDHKTQDSSIYQWRRKVMYHSPEVSFDPKLTVGDFFRLPLGLAMYKNFHPSFSGEEYWKKNSNTDLLGGLCPTTRLMSSLSSGERQQVSLLRALSLASNIILLDEAFSHLDEAKREEFTHLLKNWCTGERGIIFVSHVSLPSFTSSPISL